MSNTTDSNEQQGEALRFIRVQDALKAVSEFCDATQPFVGERFKKQLRNTIRAVPRASLAAVAGESDYDYAVRLARHLMTNRFPVKGWQPLPTLSGVLSQIDNMIAGLTKPKLTMRDLALRHTEQGLPAAAASSPLPADAKFVPPAEDALHIAICQAVQEHHGPSANAILRTALNDYKPTQLTRTELIRVQQRGGSGEVTTMMVSPAEPGGELEDDPMLMRMRIEGDLRRDAALSRLLEQGMSEEDAERQLKQEGY